MGQFRRLLERWRDGIRLGETAVVIGFWVGGLAVGDPLTAHLLFACGFLVGALSVVSDPNAARSTRVLLLLLVAVFFAAADGFYLWRHNVMV
jgi:hypothetical protein